MDSITRENDNLASELEQTETPEANYAAAEPTSNRIDALKQLTLRLFREVLQSMGESDQLSLHDGVDYYDEVRRFEIDLIRRALMQTGGHQKRAARLLNLKASTLNSKIKLFNIQVDEFVLGYSLDSDSDSDDGDGESANGSGSQLEARAA